jgi:MFS transporter, MFS domain-containing protein family, molybdate-anion transporter
MLGRLLGGIATSLLFSIFEAWLIRSHADANLKHMLGKSFSWAAYGNSVIAIVAGLVANKAANQFDMITIQENFLYAGGFLNPFDIALAALCLCGFFAATLWKITVKHRPRREATIRIAAVVVRPVMSLASGMMVYATP